MQFGIFTVMTPPFTPAACMERFSALGYDGIEWRVKDGEPADGHQATLSVATLQEQGQTLQAQCAAAGLAMPSIATYVHSTDLDAVERHLQAIAAAGISKARIGPGRWRPAEESWTEAFAAAQERYRSVAALAERYGVRCLIETHHGQLGPSVATACQLLAGLDPQWVGIMYDPANQIHEGLERYDVAIQAAGPYLGEVHAKNCRWVPGETVDGRVQWRAEWCPMREGIVDWPAVLSCLQDHGYDDWIMFEDFSQQLPLDERLRDNIAWFRSLIG